MIKGCIKLPTELVDEIEEILCLLFSSPWVILQNRTNLKAKLEGYFENKDHFFVSLQELNDQFKTIDFKEDDFIVSTVEDCDWINAYKSHFKPWKYNRFHWIPIWLKDKYEVEQGDKFIFLDPGMAFGTGNHDTTRFCLEELVRTSTPEFKSLLDIGCGSGIISITASKLGFQDVRGIDNDPDAIRISKTNTALNEIAGRISFTQFAIESFYERQQFDVVIANIQSDVLCNNVAEIVGLLKQESVLVLSGILKHETDNVTKTFMKEISRKKLLFSMKLLSNESEWSAVKFETQSQPPR